MHVSLATLPTIKAGSGKGAKLMITSPWVVRPRGEYNEEFSLAPVVNYLKTLSVLPGPPGQKDYLDGVDVAAGELVVLENCRFNKGEKKNTEELAKNTYAL